LLQELQLRHRFLFLSVLQVRLPERLVRQVLQVLEVLLPRHLQEMQDHQHQVLEE
jgi:hypothetical protein